MKLIITIFFLFLLSCAHHRDVRPGADGLHKVQVSAMDPETGAREALDQADHYCSETEKKAYIVQESKKYIGEMNENSYNTLRKASNAAKLLGTFSAAGAQSHSNRTGNTVRQGGFVGDELLGKGYLVEMSFNCK